MYAGATGGSFVIHTDAQSIPRVTVTNGGNIGIGTDNPQSQFEVFGTSPIIRSKHSTSQKYTQINHDGTNGYLDWSSGGLLFRGASNDVRLRIDANGDITTSSSITTQTSNIFYENNRRVLEVHGGTTQGWLAVGATRSDTDAYVGGINFLNRHGQADAHRFLGYIRLKSTHVNTGQYGTNVLKGQLEFATKSPAAGISTTTPDMVISPTGDVGIGLVVPNQKLHLHVAGTGGNKIKFTNDTTATGASDGFTVGIDGSENAELRLDEATNMLFVTNSTERLRISSTGQIGMGKAGSITVNGNSPLTIQESDSNSETICLRATNSGGNGSQPGIVMKTAAGGHIGGIYCDVNSDYMRLSTSGDDRVIITNTGEMGIGSFTPTPGDGILQIAGGLRVAGSASASDTTSPYIYRTPNYDHLNIATNGTERFRVTNNGVKQVKNGNLNIYQTYIDFSGDQSSTPQTAVALYRPADGTFAISTQNTERFRIRSDGRIAIGTQTINTDSMLSIHRSSSDQSQVRFTNTTTGEGGNNGLIVGIDNNEHGRIFNMENHPLRFGTNNTERFRIDEYGNIRIMTTNGQLKWLLLQEMIHL